MKVIKRDGRIVDYDKTKIFVAIQKANAEVEHAFRIDEKQIESIIEYIETLDKKRILVEDVQDIIELKLMELQHYHLAKQYIVYRYTRALVRKKNTHDESILGLIRNQNIDQFSEMELNDITSVSNQRELIASEVSKDLTKRLLIPEPIKKAHEEGAIYFHDAEYFLNPMIRSSMINLEDMLKEGTLIKGVIVKSPNSFVDACSVTTQIIAEVAQSQVGNQTLEVKVLSGYLALSKKEFELKYEQLCEGCSNEVIQNLLNYRLTEELTYGVQLILTQINIFASHFGNPPQVTLILQLDQNDPYLDYTQLIIDELISQKAKGIKNQEGQTIPYAGPRLLYCLDSQVEDYRLYTNCVNSKENLNLISAKMLKNKKTEKVNQGRVTLNLAQIGLDSQGNVKEFWRVLGQRLDICYQALMCQHYALLGTKAETSPIHWMHGAIARLNKKESIDPYLFEEYSTLSLGYVGLSEAVEMLTKSKLNEETGKIFAKKCLERLRLATSTWGNETGIKFNVIVTQEEIILARFASLDERQFHPEQSVAIKPYLDPLKIEAEDAEDCLRQLQLVNQLQFDIWGIVQIQLKKIEEKELNQLYIAINNQSQLVSIKII